VARAGNPDARVAYVDNEPVAVPSCVALLAVAVLHFVPDEDDPTGLMGDYRSGLAPGSFHALSHATGDHDPERAAAGAGIYQSTANPISIRTRDPSGCEDSVGPEHTGSWAGVARIGGSPTGNGGGA
jgi:hypothetical protein